MIDAIVGVGTYTPRFRIDRDEVAAAWDGFEASGIDRKAVPAADEDALTMGVTAARDAFQSAAVERSDLGVIAVGTTTPPVEEGDIGAQLVEILDLPRDAEVMVHTQSTRAGTAALRAAMRTSEGPALAIAADCPVGAPDDELDHAAGAGAVAVILGDGGPVTIADTATYSQEFSGTRFRNRGEETVSTYGATAYARDAFETVTGEAVSALSGSAPALAPTATDGRLPSRATRRLDADPEVYQRASELGDTGAASPFFGLLAAWADSHESVVVVGYGDGASADALLVRGSLDAEWTRETESITYAEYLRKRGYVSSEGGH